MLKRLSPHQAIQFQKIKDYYTWLTFKANTKMTCPAWDIYEEDKRIGTIFYFGDWRIYSSDQYWGDDLESFVTNLDDWDE